MRADLRTCEFVDFRSHLKRERDDGRAEENNQKANDAHDTRDDTLLAIGGSDETLLLEFEQTGRRSIGNGAERGRVVRVGFLRLPLRIVGFFDSEMLKEDLVRLRIVIDRADELLDGSSRGQWMGRVR